MNKQDLQVKISGLTNVIRNATLFKDELQSINDTVPEDNSIERMLRIGEAGTKYGLLDPTSAASSKLLPQVLEGQALAS